MWRPRPAVVVWLLLAAAALTAGYVSGGGLGTAVRFCAALWALSFAARSCFRWAYGLSAVSRG